MSTALASRATGTDHPTEVDDRSLTLGWTELRVDREDIRFSTLHPGVLEIEIIVHNDGARRSTPTVALLQSAPLGAFVRWRPLGVLNIPAIAAGRTERVRHKVKYKSPAVLGGADKIPPSRLLTALDQEESDNAGRTDLAGDLLGLIGRGGVYWAGNLNLFFPGKDVERHMAQALRVYPGRVNMAMFIVGDRGHDAYRFRMTGEAANWESRLLDASFDCAIASGVEEGDGLPEDKWLRPASGLILLALKPPENADAGNVNVHVLQQSTGKEAIVEFTLDPEADGPGCYVV